MPPGQDTALPPSATDGFATTIGLELQEASGDRVTGRLEVQPHLHQPYGIVHGGVWCAVVETLASVGAALWFAERGSVVGVSNHTNFLRAVREGVVRAEALPIQRGRTQQLWEVTVRDDADRLVASGQVRLANIAPEVIGG
jgi:uncharacterized protein (TIGR00369 family)